MVVVSFMMSLSCGATCQFSSVLFLFFLLPGCMRRVLRKMEILGRSQFVSQESRVSVEGLNAVAYSGICALEC